MVRFGGKRILPNESWCLRRSHGACPRLSPVGTLCGTCHIRPADVRKPCAARITAALPRGAVGPYQLQAAIAAIHDEAPSTEQTDWAQIVALYELLMRISDNPVVALNHAAAVAMAGAPDAGLDLLAALAADRRIAADHRLHAVRAHLLELTGDQAAARAAYQEAARRSTSLPVQRYLNARADRLAGG
jgi:predicted RNA polymerase sigma factor